MALLSITSTGLLAGDADRFEAYTTIKYHLNLYQFKEAEHLMDSFLEKYPDDPFILTEKAFLYTRVDSKHKEALALLKKALVTYPAYYYANYLYASTLYLFHTSGMTYDPGDGLSLQDAAVKYLKASFEDNDTFYDGFLLLGIILHEQKKYTESNRYLDKAAGLKKSPEPYMYMAGNYNHLNDLDKEIEAYKKVLSFSPYDPKALFALSRYYLKQGAAKDASVYLERLFMKYPNDKKVSFDYLYSLFAAKEVDKFLEVSETMDVSGVPFLVFARAFFLTRKERRGEAVKLLEGLEKPDLKASLLLADLHKQEKNYFPAYRILMGIEDKGKNYLYYSLQFEVLSGLGLNGRLLEAFEKVKTDTAVLEEFTLRDYYNIIFARVDSGAAAAVLELARFVRTKLTGETELLEDLVRALEYLSTAGAIDTGKIAIDLNRYLIVSLCRKKGKYAEAVSLLEGMIQKGRSAGPGPYMELCDIYIDRKEPEKAEKLLDEMKRKFPTSLEVKNFRAYFYALENKHLELALKLSEYTLSKEGGSPAYLDTYGYILFKMGRFDEAATYLEKAYQKNPFEEEIMEHLADYYRLKKDSAKVLEIYQRAVDNGVDFKDKLLEKIKKLKDAQSQPAD